MIGLDVSVLARYYIDDEADAEAQRQRLAARRLIESGQLLMVSKSVVLEFEWVMRGYYNFEHAEVASVMRHERVTEAVAEIERVARADPAVADYAQN